jgi:hypothetical protein
MVGLGLWRRRVRTPAEVVGSLVAVQAQEHRYARWSVGQRAGASAAEVDAAFDSGAILRTHVLRPTWHYVTPADLPWLLALSGARIDAANARRYAELELDPATCRRATDLIADAVADGPKTRRELGVMLLGHGIAPDGQRMPHLLLHAELHAAVCSGPMRDAQHTYAAFSDRVPARSPVGEDEALADLARRWFTTRGPASVRDFAWWSGLPIAIARAALASVQTELASYEVDGRTYWFSAWPRSSSRPRVDLVQCYDEVVISYTETRDVLATAGIDFPVPRSIDGFTHVMLRDGRLLGHWRLEQARTGVEVRVRPAGVLDDQTRSAMTSAILGYQRFDGG